VLCLLAIGVGCQTAAANTTAGRHDILHNQTRDVDSVLTGISLQTILNGGNRMMLGRLLPRSV
jgi:hypothetical protein